jgi:para-aminobenzoate synthetase/4-amino-4-deoxychorismate lyase
MSLSEGINSVVLHDADVGCWLCFSEPVEIYAVNALDQVVATLAKIEKRVQSEDLHAAGFVSYEASAAFDSALKTKDDSSGFPLLWFGLYDAPKEIDFTAWAAEGHESSNLTTDWGSSISNEEYVEAIDRVKEYIKSGDTYQVNFSFRLLAALNRNLWAFFVDLISAQGAGYGAFVNTPEWAVCSASPELFFRKKEDRIISRPMKGTARRGLTHEADLAQREWLKNSEKNRAENLMIVDMVRNDLGRVAQTGSVNVDELFTIEKYPTVWQMVSEVSCQAKCDIPSVFKALFPPASITGAPKKRTMEIIEELEVSPRRIYTGSVGFLAPDRAQFNVAIRTVLVNKKTDSAAYGIGGGIVWDSHRDDEYEECLTKARILTQSSPSFSLLETLKWSPEDGFWLLDKHMERLKHSADYFSIEGDRDEWAGQLALAQGDFGSQLKRVRVLLSQKGKLSVECESFPLTEPGSRRKVALAKSAINSSDVFLYHKTTHRVVYDNAKKGLEEYDDVLLWNENEELTESCIANLVVEVGGVKYTPPIECGLLGGTFRSALLEEGEICERIIRKDELKNCAQLYLINSVRGWQEVDLDLSSDV